jgi:hypothetical protein
MYFNQLVETLLLEMPWLDFKVGNNRFAIDLEMEKYLIKQNNTKTYDWNALIKVISSIVEGNKYVDKRGDSIQLTTSEEKQAFINALKNDMIFDSYKRKFPFNGDRGILYSLFE